MRHRILLLSLISVLVTSCGISNKMLVTSYSDGYWGKWIDLSRESLYKASYQGSVDNFIVYNHSLHPSRYTFKLEIRGMNVKNDKITDIKSNTWYEYWGTLYFDQNTDFKTFALYGLQSLSPHFGGVQQKTVRVKVMKVSSGYTYNVFSGDIGFGITIPWLYSKKIK